MSVGECDLEYARRTARSYPVKDCLPSIDWRPLGYVALCRAEHKQLTDAEIAEVNVLIGNYRSGKLPERLTQLFAEARERWLIVLRDVVREARGESDD